jgi:hypothetical protein
MGRSRQDRRSLLVDCREASIAPTIMSEHEGAVPATSVAVKRRLTRSRPAHPFSLDMPLLASKGLDAACVYRSTSFKDL